MIFKKNILMFFSFVAFRGKNGKNFNKNRRFLAINSQQKLIFAYYTFLIKIYNISLSSDIKVQLHTFMTRYNSQYD
jgi:hypothetical protein